MDGRGFALREGMTVYDCSGEKLGTVQHIFSGAPRGGANENDNTPVPAGGPVEAVTGKADGEITGYSDGVEIETVQVTEIPGGYNQGGAGQYTYQAAANTGYSGPAGSDIDRLAGAGGGAGGTQLTPSETKYIEVRHGGLFGFGGESLYVPFSAVDAASAGDSITLNCSAEDCGRLYANQPEPPTAP